jgi:hypothetical protein
MLKLIMGGPKPGRNANRTWQEVEDLLETLAPLARKFFERREISIWANPDDGVQIILKADGAEYTGKGRDPWEAAQDLGKKAAAVAEALAKTIPQ